MVCRLMLRIRLTVSVSYRFRWKILLIVLCWLVLLNRVATGASVSSRLKISSTVSI